MSHNFEIVTLRGLVRNYDEEYINDKLSSYSCVYNGEIENFLKYKSVQLQKQNVSPSYLIYSTDDGGLLLGYFTLSNKIFTIDKGRVPNLLFKKLIKFGDYDERTNELLMSAPLIAQLGKNFADGSKGLIGGDVILDNACDMICDALTIIGGKVIYLECEDKPKLVDFYTSNDFRQFGKRYLDSGDGYLLQFLRYVEI